jgi:hypothetical protein
LLTHTEYPGLQGSLHVPWHARTDQGKAALRSMFELKGKAADKSVALYFGPQAPAGHEGECIKTNPGKGWFVYFRIYGPEQPAFDGSWKPGDFAEVK